MEPECALCKLPRICDEHLVLVTDQLAALRVLRRPLGEVLTQHAEEGGGAVIAHEQLAPALPALTQRILAEKER